jgi:hypothetical protein
MEKLDGHLGQSDVLWRPKNRQGCEERKLGVAKVYSKWDEDPGLLNG